MHPQTNAYPPQPQPGWPSNNLTHQMANINLSGPPQSGPPGLYQQPQQQQQQNVPQYNNNNQGPPPSMIPGNNPFPSTNNYPNNNNNQFPPPAKAGQSGPGLIPMLPTANKGTGEQFSPVNSSGPLSSHPPVGYQHQVAPDPTSQPSQQQILQQGQRPPIPGESANFIQSNGHTNGTEMLPNRTPQNPPMASVSSHQQVNQPNALSQPAARMPPMPGQMTSQQNYATQAPAEQQFPSMPPLPNQSGSNTQQQQQLNGNPSQMNQQAPPIKQQQYASMPSSFGQQNTSLQQPHGMSPMQGMPPPPGTQSSGPSPMQGMPLAPGMQSTGLPPMHGMPPAPGGQQTGLPPMHGMPPAPGGQQTGLPPMHGMPPAPGGLQTGLPPAPGMQSLGLPSMQGMQGMPPAPGAQQPGMPFMPGMPQVQQGFPPQQQPQQQQPGFPPMQSRPAFNQQPGMYPQQGAQQGAFPQQQHGQFPQQPAMGAPFQQPTSPMQQAAPQRRLDPDQMPNPIQVMAENQRTTGGPFSTLQVGQVPPLVTTDFVTQDQGNSGPRYVRSTMYNVPVTTDMMKQSAVPFALVISPYARAVEGEMAPPIVDFGEIGPIRCIRCKAYMSPHMQFVDAGRRFQCLLCKATTEVPAEYFQHLDHTGQRVDKYERPELVLGTYEFVATKDYCRNNVPPKPPAMVFVIDVSYNNVKSGLVHLLCSQIKNIIRNLPIDQGKSQSNMKVGFITYNSAVHFYNIKSTLAQPQMMVVGDVHEMFMPLLDGFLADPVESEAVIDLLMEQIPKMYGDTRETETILLPAIQAGVEALKASECAGKLLIFHSSLPVSDAPGQLKNRDDRKLLGTEKEKTVLTPQSTAYNNLGQECVNVGCSVDMFVFNNSYIDLATIGQVSRLTGGELYKYTYFQADIDGQRLVADIIKNISRPIAFDTVMRVRTSTGTRPTDFYGHFFMSNTTDMEIASIDCDKSVAIEIKHDDKLSAEENVYVQIALLYTSCGGQRRLRVMNLALKTCTQLADLFRSCDLDTTILFFAKQGVTKLLEHTPKVFKDNLVNRAAQILACYRKHCASPTSAGQLILPECLKLLPLYVSCLLKNDAFSGGSDLTVDDRSYAMYFVSTMDLPTSVTFFYPRLIPIHNVDVEGSDVPLPIRCTIDKMTDDGAYILDNGIYMFIYLGLGLSAEFNQSVFGVQNTQQVDTEKIALPVFDNLLSKRVRGIVESIQGERTRCMRIALVRQRDKLEAVLRHFLIEDRGSSGSESYVDFLCFMHKEIRSLLS